MSVVASLNGNRIWVVSDYPVSALQRDVPGSRFSKEPVAHWSCPLTMESCLLLRERFGKDMKVEKELADWARARLAEEAEMSALGKAERAELSNLEAVAPALFKAVQGRTYQTVAARFIAQGRPILLGDTPGLGKTIECLAGIEESQVAGPYLIVAPKSTLNTVWGREITRWVPRAEVLVMPEGRDNRELKLSIAAEGKDLSNLFVVVNPAMVRVAAFWRCKECGTDTPVKARKELKCKHAAASGKPMTRPEYGQLFDIEWGAIVADESDQCLLRKTGLPTQTRRGMEMLRDSMRKDGLRIAASGTPFRGRPHLLWSTLNWLRPEEFPAFWRWAEMLFEMDEGYGGSKIIGKLKREDLLYKTLDRIMLRRTKQEVASELPPKLYVGTPLVAGNESSPVAVWLPMSPVQEKSYRQMLDLSVAEIEGGQMEAVGVLAEMTRLKQFSNCAFKRNGTKEVWRSFDGEKVKVTVPNYDPVPTSNKLDWIIQRLIEIGHPDDPQYKVVIASQFTDILQVFAAEIERQLKIETLSVTGAVTGARRDEAVDAFNGDGPSVMFLNTKAGGVGITLDAADEMIIIDETHVPDDQEQLEERINNRRPEEKVLQRRFVYLKSLGTIDERIAAINMEREHDSKTILDSRRGVTAWAKKVLEVV